MDGQRRHLLLGALRSSLHLSAPGGTRADNSASAAVAGRAHAATEGHSAAAPSYRCRSRSCGRPTEHAGNGTDDDAPVPCRLAGRRGSAWSAPGRTGSDPTWKSRPTCGSCRARVLRPDSRSNRRVGSRASITAGDYRIFDDSQGGAFRGTETVGWARSSWFPAGDGTAGPRRAAQQRFPLGFSSGRRSAGPRPYHPDHREALPRIDSALHVARLSPATSFARQTTSRSSRPSVESGIGAS